ncbi:MAG: hypothetical protein OCC45_10415 [Desulfotalea sp.]
MLNTPRQIKALKLIQDTVKNYGVKALADELGIATGTLYADIDPKSIGRRTNKLGFLDYIKIIEITGDTTSLENLCADFNKICLPLPEPKEDLRDWLLICASMAKEGAEATSALASAIADGKLTKKELIDCERECLEALQTIGSAYVTIKAQIDGGHNE